MTHHQTQPDCAAVCCYCDAYLSCAQCGMEQPATPAQPAGMREDYRDVIDEALIVRHLGIAKGNPRDELNQILSWEVAVALDPRVSEAAQTLIDQGKAALPASPAPEGMREALKGIPLKIWADKIENTTRLKRVREADSYGAAMDAAVIECFYDFEAKRLVTLLRALAALALPAERPAVAQASTYTEICMNEKCPRGCGVPVEVVRASSLPSTKSK